MIEKLNQHFSFTNPASIHDEEALTALELAGRQGSKINEIIVDQNALRKETNDHLTEQDKAIEKMNTVTMPAKVTTEVQKRIDNGDFDDAINIYAGDLEGRVNNLLESVPEGGTTMDAEVIDGRVGVNGRVFPNIGEAIRGQMNNIPVEVVYNKNKGSFIRSNGQYIKNTNFDLSDAIPLNGAKEVVITFTNTNPNISNLGFATQDHPAYVTTCGYMEQTIAGTYRVAVPENAKYMFVGDNRDMNGNNGGVTPWVYIPIDATLSKLGEKVGGLIEEAEQNKITLEWGDHVGEFIRAGGVWASNDNFSLSNAIAVNAGEIYLIKVTTPNVHISGASFAESNETGAQILEKCVFAEAGSYIVKVPNNAKYMFISSATNTDGITKGEHTVYGYKGSINVTPYTPVDVIMPDSYTLVVGDSFELFYASVINAPSPDQYFINVSCDMGYSNRRKFYHTATTENIGDHTLTITLRDTTGQIIGYGSTILNVIAKASNPSRKNVMCLGDSLTAGGQWVAEAKNRLNANGITNVNFIGEKGNTGAKYTATGGWTINSYLALSDTNPLYNGSEIDVAGFVQSLGESSLDYCVIFLGWNHFASTEVYYKQVLKQLIDYIRADFPACEILLFGIQKPDKDALGINYQPFWSYYDTVKFVYNLDAWLEDVAKDFTGIYPVSICGQFDSEYNLPATDTAVNNRSSTKIRTGTNAIHPTDDGYMQIADVAYRAINKLLQ